jgi:hypothetical protein
MGTFDGNRWPNGNGLLNQLATKMLDSKHLHQPRQQALYGFKRRL